MMAWLQYALLSLVVSCILPIRAFDFRCKSSSLTRFPRSSHSSSRRLTRLSALESSSHSLEEWCYQQGSKRDDCHITFTNEMAGTQTAIAKSNHMHSQIQPVFSFDNWTLSKDSLSISLRPTHKQGRNALFNPFRTSPGHLKGWENYVFSIERFVKYPRHRYFGAIVDLRDTAGETGR